MGMCRCRLVWSRTPGSHPGNRGSNPRGGTIRLRGVVESSSLSAKLLFEFAIPLRRDGICCYNAYICFPYNQLVNATPRHPPRKRLRLH